MKKIILIIPLLVSAFILYLLIHLGYFKSIEMSEISKGPLNMIYMDHMGSYHKLVPYIEKVEAWANANKIDCRESFGEYLDNPEIIEEARLKSRGGCIVPTLSNEIIPLIPAEFKTQIIPERNYLRIEFKGSPAIGPYKVYPKANEYIQKNNLKLIGPTIEVYKIYDQDNMTTEYLFPIENKSEMITK